MIFGSYKVLEKLADEGRPACLALNQSGRCEAGMLPEAGVGMAHALP